MELNSGSIKLKGWETTLIRSKRMFTVVPLEDWDKHDEESQVCKCNPRIGVDHLGYKWINHRTFDGREHLERALIYALGNKN